MVNEPNEPAQGVVHTRHRQRSNWRVKGSEANVRVRRAEIDYAVARAVKSCIEARGLINEGETDGVLSAPEAERLRDKIREIARSTADGP